jgi:L-malate glycosyltransferase
MKNKSKLKILIVGPDSPHVANFISRFNPDDYQLELISTGKHHISFQPNTKLDFSLIRFWNVFKTPFRIRRIAKTFQPDVVWMHQANSIAFYSVLALKKRYPLALTVWGSDILISPLNSLWVRLMTRFVLRNVDAITADAKYLGEKTLELSPKPATPLHICQFGINPLEVNLKKERIIFSNRGHKSLYRIDEVIRAFHRFQEAHPSDWTLVVAGSGEETPKLKKLALDLNLGDKVTFVGFLSAEENAAWYGRSALYISIPESDGTAVSLLEAMHYACVPIVSDLPANREWITHGENGFVANNLSENFIQEALQVNPDKAQQKNKVLIQAWATPEASSAKFQEVIANLLMNKKR